MCSVSLAALSGDEQLYIVNRRVRCPPPGLSGPHSELDEAGFRAAPRGGVTHPPLGLHEPLSLSAIWQGQRLACEVDCSSSDVSTSELPSPVTSDFTEEPIAVAAAEGKVEAPGGYVPGRILQESIAQSQHAALVTLRLEEAVGHTTGCPTAGSVGHRMGLCRPCDFFHRQKCTKAAECKFCHLCGPQESRRRKRESRKAMKFITSSQASVNIAACRMMWL
mmetsp:Transcript_112462/g.290532  ORF Transcript_112462/g.290532 Transcript_112462/m.290532 type:complete len:221 (-) Transcript_112462:234-896(-)